MIFLSIKLYLNEIFGVKQYLNEIFGAKQCLNEISCLNNTQMR